MKSKNTHLLLTLLIWGLICMPCIVKGQATAGKDNLIRVTADETHIDNELFPGIYKMMGDVVFTQGGVIGYCDSAYWYRGDNNLEAFGEKIIIHLNDSVTLTGKHLLYNGNARIANISKDVQLQDITTTLYTDSLIYNLNTDVGYYLTGGKTVNNDNTLTSLLGHYYTNEDMVVLKEDVLLVNETYTMNCDSLAFNTKTEVCYFISRTHLVSEENEIFTNGGWYDTKQDIALLVDDVSIYNKEQRVFGDSIYYNKSESFAKGWRNIVLIDTVKNYVAQGDYMEYYEHGGISTITENAMLIMIDNSDSLYVHADTFKIHVDSLQNMELLRGYYHVKFFRDDMQGACDSLVYIATDSIMTMYYNPVVWSNEYQLTADTIVFKAIDSVNSEIHLIKSAFIVSSLYDDTEFNQIKGLNIIGHLYNQEMQTVDVIGNAECLYYILEEDSSLIGINSSATSEMRITFEDSKIQYLTMYNQPDGKIYPDHILKQEDRLLKDFRWLFQYRPQNVEDIFINPIPRSKLKVENEGQP